MASAVFAVRGQPAALAYGAAFAALVNLPDVLDGRLSRRTLRSRPAGKTPASPWWYLAYIAAGLVGAAALPLALAVNVTDPRTEVSIRHEAATQLFFGVFSTTGVTLVGVFCQQWWVAGRRARAERGSERPSRR